MCRAVAGKLGMNERYRKSSIVRRKIQRVRNGKTIRTLDLFAGCGGLSLGFASAGFSIIGAVEVDPKAAESHALNFHPQGNVLHESGKSKAIDITSVSPEALVDMLHLGRTTESAVDVIIGGPPCQAFARVGRAKLREVDQHPEAFLRDSRANLYLRYIDYVRSLIPLAVVMENVPDALNYGGHNICEEVCEVLSEEGYSCQYTMLNAAFYGVPQMRERMFLFAWRKELESTIKLPEPTHYVQLPAGYEGTRAVALKTVRNQALFRTRGAAGSAQFYMAAPIPAPTLPPAVTAKEATEDLPPILGHLDGSIRRGTRRFTDYVKYRMHGAKLNSYSRLMREWPGFACSDGVKDHVIRSLPRDYQIFQAMKPGDQYPQAHRIALSLFEERLAELAKSGQRLAVGSPEYESLKKSIVPPYDPSKFPNKWRKMEADLPARTLLAHLGKDSYSHIHYDSGQARTISVREAARLQSFPDGFIFAGTMNPAFRQIGNAVPPLLANAIAHSVLGVLGVTPAEPPLNQRLL